MLQTFSICGSSQLSSYAAPLRGVPFFRGHIDAHTFVPRAQPRRFDVKVSASLDPWKTLGVSSDASEKDIKRAHRKLVLKHHPDLAQGDTALQARFFAIQEAYEILIGKRHGKEVGARNSSTWDFHDWYWQFSMRRRKGGVHATAPPSRAAMRMLWREQMSGLKAKASARAQKHRYTNTRAHAGSPSASAAEAVWRSTTINARTVTTEAGVSSASTVSEIPVDAGRSSMAPRLEQAEVDSNVAHGRNALHQVPLIQRAVHAVHHAQNRHHHAVHTHAHRIYSQIVDFGHNLTEKLRVEGLKEILTEDAVWASSYAHSNAAEQQNDAYKNVFGQGGHRGWGGTTTTSAEYGSGGTAQKTHGTTSTREMPPPPPPQLDTHTRKFSDQQHVQARVVSQLAGLKRRAAVKRVN